MPLSSIDDDPLIFKLLLPTSVENPNSRSACSGNGVGVSNTSVSTIEPFDDPNDTLWK